MPAGGFLDGTYRAGVPECQNFGGVKPHVVGIIFPPTPIEIGLIHLPKVVGTSSGKPQFPHTLRRPCRASEFCLIRALHLYLCLIDLLEHLKYASSFPD